MSDNMKCIKCGKEISPFRLRYFSFFTLTMCSRCWKINKLSFVTAKDKKNWILMDSLFQLGILVFFVTEIFDRGSQFDGAYFIGSLCVCMISAYTLDSYIEKGKVFIDTEGIG